MSIIDNSVELDALQLQLKDTILFELAGDNVILTDEAQCSKPPPDTTTTGFFGAVKELIDTTQTDIDQRVLLTETMPEDMMFQDPNDGSKELSGYILTTVLRREPGTLAGGNQPFNSKRRDVKPKIIRSTISKDPLKPGETTYIISKRFDNLLGLNICTRTNKRANELADWFENLMEMNHWFFNQKGFPLVYMDSRLPDLRRDDSLMKVSFRPYRYFVRTETYFTITEHQLNRLIVQVTTRT